MTSIFIGWSRAISKLNDAVRDQLDDFMKRGKFGMILWDGESKGTLNNIQILLGAGKKTMVYFSPETAFYKLATSDDLTGLVSRCK